jgi:antitoxin component YwqK of YwqJK toxin-antitoxin module
MIKIACVFTVLLLNVGHAMCQVLDFNRLNKNSIEICEDGLAKEVWYYNNGNVKQSGTYLYGKKYGKWVEYYSNGSKKTVKYFGTEGKPAGKWTTYYENGKKWNASMYNNGKLDGAWIYWYENGKKWHQLTYSEGALKGKWSFWNEKGKLNEKGIYKIPSSDS